MIVVQTVHLNVQLKSGDVNETESDDIKCCEGHDAYLPEEPFVDQKCDFCEFEGSAQFWKC